MADGAVLVYLIKMDLRLSLLVSFNFFWLSSALLAATKTPVLVVSKPYPGHPTWFSVEVTADIKNVTFVVRSSDKGASLEDLRSPNALVAINGAYFDPKFAPIAWLKDSSKEYHKKSRSNRGGVFAIVSDTGYLGSVTKVAFSPDFAVQNFPLLVQPPGTSAMKGDDGKRAARTVICAKDADSNGNTKLISLIVILSQPSEGPTLFELAAQLAKPIDAGGFACTAALNLDGGPSTGIWLAPEFSSVAKEARGPITSIGHAISLEAKYK